MANSKPNTTTISADDLESLITNQPFRILDRAEVYILVGHLFKDPGYIYVKVPEGYLTTPRGLAIVRQNRHLCDNDDRLVGLLAQVGGWVDSREGVVYPADLVAFVEKTPGCMRGYWDEMKLHVKPWRDCRFATGDAENAVDADMKGVTEDVEDEEETGATEEVEDAETAMAVDAGDAENAMEAQDTEDEEDKEEDEDTAEQRAYNAWLTEIEGRLNEMDEKWKRKPANEWTDADKKALDADLDDLNSRYNDGMAMNGARERRVERDFEKQIDDWNKLKENVPEPKKENVPEPKKENDAQAQDTAIGADGMEEGDMALAMALQMSVDESKRLREQADKAE